MYMYRIHCCTNHIIIVELMPRWWSFFSRNHLLMLLRRHTQGSLNYSVHNAYAKLQVHVNISCCCIEVFSYYDAMRFFSRIKTIFCTLSIMIIFLWTTYCIFCNPRPIVPESIRYNILRTLMLFYYFSYSNYCYRTYVASMVFGNKKLVLYPPIDIRKLHVSQLKAII